MIASSSGSARVGGLRLPTPLTATWPSTIRRSPPRRDVSPACARILLSLSLAMLGDGRQLRDDQLALDLGQIGDIAQPERDQELARRLEEGGATGSHLAAGHEHDAAPDA